MGNEPEKFIKGTYPNGLTTSSDVRLVQLDGGYQLQRSNGKDFYPLANRATLLEIYDLINEFFAPQKLADLPITNLPEGVIPENN